MANIPEILIDLVNGPILTLVHSNGTSSSLSINAQNQLTALSGSTPIPYATSTTASYVSFANIANLPAGIVSSSTQLPAGVISSSAQLPAGTVSSSAQVLVSSTVWSSSAQLPSGIYSSSAQLPAGIVSSSAQVLVGSTIWSSSAQLPANIVSSSAQTVANLANQQISATGITASLLGTASWANNATTAQTASFVATASWAQNARTASFVDFVNVANKPTLVSASAQVLVGSGVWSASAQLPTGIVSSSAQVVSSLSGQQVSAAGITSSLFGTASWAAKVTSASYALTASYVNMNALPAVGYSYLNKTGTQPITVANTFQGVSFDSNVRIDSSDWTYSATTSSLTCLTAGVYLIDATFFVQKTKGTATVGGVRLTKNGAEITGSFSSYTFASNNMIQPLAVQVLDTFNVNDILAAQIIGGGTNIQLAPVPAIGSVVTRPSATLRVVEG